MFGSASPGRTGSPIGYGSDFAALPMRQGQEDPRRPRYESRELALTTDELRNSQQKSIAWARYVGITQMMTASLAAARV